MPDATSGFRALTREAALRVNVFSRFSYTLETIIQLGLQRARVTSVPVGANPVRRPSRPYRSTPEFVLRQTWTLLQIYALYRPFELFAASGGLLVAVDLVPGVRFVLLYVRGGGQGHVQSLLLAALLILLGALLEDVRLRLRRMELDRSGGDPRPPTPIA